MTPPLDKLIALGDAVRRLRESMQHGHDPHFYSIPIPGVPGGFWTFHDDLKSLLAACNAAPMLAKRLKEIREILGPLDTTEWEGQPLMRICVTIPQAKRLAALLTEQVTDAR